METSFDPICPKTLCSLSFTPVMLHIKFIKIGLLVSEILKFESVDGPLVYYKLTLRAFSLGELIIFVLDLNEGRNDSPFRVGSVQHIIALRWAIQDQWASGFYFSERITHFQPTLKWVKLSCWAVKTKRQPNHKFLTIILL